MIRATLNTLKDQQLLAKGYNYSLVKGLKNWLSKRSYTEKVIGEQVNMALRSEEKVKEKDGQNMKENGIVLVVAYKPNFKNLSFSIRKSLQFLYAQTERNLHQHLSSPSEVLGT